MKPMQRLAPALLVAASAFALGACSTPEDKVASFNQRGQALLHKGDLVKARLEFQNALQINPSAVPALYGLAEVAERSRDWQASYQLLVKVVELAPAHLDAQVKIGKLLLASGQLDKALETSDTALNLGPDSSDALALRAAVLLKLNDAAAAMDFARRALAKNPRHVEALVVLASERLQAGDPERAIAFLDRGLEGNERNVALQMIKVQALEKIGQPERTEQVLRRMVALFPDNAEYRYLLASFYTSHKQVDKAEAEYRAIVGADPKALPPKLELVRFLGTARGLDAAATQLEQFIRAEPRAQDLKLQLAGLRILRKDDAAAIALWKEVIAGAGDSAPGIRARGALAAYHLARKDKASAKPLIEEMLAKDARDQQALLLRADIAVAERRLEDAITDLRNILRDTPDSPAAQLMLARTHELQGLRDLATQHFASAAQAARYAPPFAMPYAEHLMATGRARQVEGVLKELLRGTPGHVPALRLLAQSYLRTGDLAAAQAVADQAARQEGGAVMSNQIEGAIHIARREFDGGIASYRRAYELAPAESQSMTALVRSYVVANKQREALSFLQSVVRASPQNVTARILQGHLLAQTGNMAAAREALEQAVALNPANPDAYQALVGAHVSGKNFGEAMAAVDRGLKAVPNDFGLRLTRAGLLELQGHPEEAIAAYEALLKERPNAGVIANNLASMLADNRKDAASIRRAYDLAQRFRSTDIALFKDTVGWTTHLAGKHKEAADLLKSASAGAPDVAVVHYHYGMNQLALNNVQAAKEALQRSIELAKASPFPQVDEARKTLQAL
jgi:tetratricopeptide (TPR) repeat protein